MKSPMFLEIWIDNDWFNYFIGNSPTRTREYYKVRSVIRMAIWIPLSMIMFYVLMCGVAVFA